MATAQRNVSILPIPRHGYVLDQAGMLDDEAISKINRISADAQRTGQTAIYVVTIPSLSSVGAFSIDAYAARLLSVWEVERKSQSKALILIAQEDRKARIEVGPAWGHDVDTQCKGIVDGWVAASFKRKEYSKGMLDGVVALDTLLRTGEAPEGSLASMGSSGYDRRRCVSTARDSRSS